MSKRSALRPDLFAGQRRESKLDRLGDPHALLANVLMILAGGHSLVAIWHQLVLKDGLLGRMFRPEGN